MFGITKTTRSESNKKTDKTTRQRVIYNTLKGKRMTAREIATALGYSDLNAVKPRLTELMEMNMVKPVAAVKDMTTNRTVAVYEVVEK